MTKPAWTRDNRIERLNRMVLSRLPRWTAEDVVNHRAKGEVTAALVAELSDTSEHDRLTKILVLDKVWEHIVRMNAHRLATVLIAEGVVVPPRKLSES